MPRERRDCQSESLSILYLAYVTDLLQLAGINIHTTLTCTANTASMGNLANGQRVFWPEGNPPVIEYIGELPGLFPYLQIVLSVKSRYIHHLKC